MIEPTESSADERDRLALARLRASGARRRIRLSPDFGRDWPLWEDDHDGDVINILASPADYGLSESLTQQIHAWFSFWQQHYDPDARWDSSSNYTAWHEEGRNVASAMRREVGEFAHVQYLGG